MALPYLNRALEIDPADEGSWLKIALGTSYLKPGLAFTAASKFFPKHSLLIDLPLLAGCARVSAIGVLVFWCASYLSQRGTHPPSVT